MLQPFLVHGFDDNYIFAVISRRSFGKDLKDKCA
jgi:hypothetical protein